MLSTPRSNPLPRLLSTVVSIATFSATLAFAAPPSTAASEPGAPARPGGVALTWTPEYMSDNHHYSRAEAVELARKNDLVAAMPFAFAEHSDAMRAANPKVDLLAYANATLATEGATAGLPEAAFAHDTEGRRIKAPEFGTYLMESSTWRWRVEANQQCDERAAQGGFDGCLVDMLTLGIFSRGYVTSLPVNPYTGSTYSEAEYRQQMISLAEHYRNQSPGLIHVGNSVENDYRYWRSKTAPSRPLVNSQPAAQMEDFLRGSGTGVNAFPSPEGWVRNVDVIRDMESQNTSGLFTTKLWVGATADQIKQWQAYTMASFLMGAGGRSYLAFTSSRNKAGVMGTALPYTMPKNIGTPSGPMVQEPSGVWAREFSNGLSVVNPTSTGVSVPLDAPMRTLSGGTASTVWMPPNSGQILLDTTSSSSTSTPASGDTTAPTVTLDDTNQNGGTVTWSGRLSDDVRAAEVRFAVRNQNTNQWLQPDGSWGSYEQLTAQVGSSSGTSTGWTASRTLPSGSYGISVIGVDGAGNLSGSRPWGVTTADTQAPIVTLADITGSGNTVRWSGRLTDDVRAAEVRFAVRNQNTDQWLRSDGSWGSYQQLTAQVTSSTGTATGWTASRNLPSGSYGISVIGVDGAGNLSESQPWRVTGVGG